ncbi:MAG: Ig-like domain-containing protein [Myxococcota bacterium]|nr:Ig-like domain-containing protein [Myxococcota bacterium]
MAELRQGGFVFVLLMLGGLLLLSGCAESTQRLDAGLEYTAPPGSEPTNSGDDDDAASDDDDDEGDLDDSGVHVLSTDPEVGSTEHLYRDPIVIGFNNYAAGAQVLLYDADSMLVPVEPEWNASMTVLTVTPQAFLDPVSDYRVLITVGDAQLEYEFQTSEIGLPVDPDLLDGTVFGLDLSVVASEARPAVAALVRTSAERATWLLEARPAEGDSLSFEVAFGLGDLSTVEQSACSRTTSAGGLPDDQGALEPAGSFFFVTGEELSLPLDANTLVLESWELSGDFSADLSSMVAVSLTGWLRVASLVEEDGSDPDAGCDWVEENLALTCEPCLSDPAVACVPVEIEDIAGTAIPITLAPQGAVDLIACQNKEDQSGLLTCSFAEGRGAHSGLSCLGLLALALIVRRRL